MQQPNIVEYWTEKATAEVAKKVATEVAREKTREHILQVLAIRLRPETGPLFKSTLDAIDDRKRLEELLRAAVLAESADDFRQALAGN